MRSLKLNLILIAIISNVCLLHAQILEDSICLRFEYEYFPLEDSQTVSLYARIMNEELVASIQHSLEWDSEKLYAVDIPVIGNLIGLSPASIFIPANGRLNFLWDDPNASAQNMDECELLYTISFINTTGNQVPVDEEFARSNTGFATTKMDLHIKNNECCNQVTSFSNSKNEKIQLRKNPVSSIEEIEIFGSHESRFELLSLTGKIVKSNEELKRGIYFILVRTNNGSKTLKLMVQ